MANIKAPPTPIPLTNLSTTTSSSSSQPTKEHLEIEHLREQIKFVREHTEHLRRKIWKDRIATFVSVGTLLVATVPLWWAVNRTTETVNRTTERVDRATSDPQNMLPAIIAALAARESQTVASEEGEDAANSNATAGNGGLEHDEPMRHITIFNSSGPDGNVSAGTDHTEALPSRIFHGVVTSLEGEPVEGVTVRLDSGEQRLAGATTDAKGQYRLEHVGRLVPDALTFTKQGFYPYVLQPDSHFGVGGKLLAGEGVIELSPMLQSK